MALKESCGKGRFSNFSIAKLLEKGEEEEEEREESEDEETRVGQGDDWEVKAKEEEGGDHHIKQEKIELLGAAELSGLIKLHSCFMRIKIMIFFCKLASSKIIPLNGKIENRNHFRCSSLVDSSVPQTTFANNSLKRTAVVAASALLSFRMRATIAKSITQVTTHTHCIFLIVCGQ